MAKKSPEEEKAVAKSTNAAAALYEADAGTGFEKTNSDDYIIPFVKLLQKMSPEVDPDHSAHVEGAKAGMFLDTGTGEVLESVEFIPCFYHRTIVEWKDRDSGGGFVTQHDPGYEQQFSRDESGRWVTPNGTYLADTRYFFGLRVKGPGETTAAVISFTSTQIKKSRTWLTRMQSLKFTKKDGTLATYPIFSHAWRFSSVGEENERGSWKGYKIDLIGLIQDPVLIGEARKAHLMFQSSASRIKPAVDASHPAGDVPF